jgi:hypothetical protein
MDVYQPVCFKGVNYGNMCYAVQEGASMLQVTPGVCKKVAPGQAKKGPTAVMPKKNTA